MLNFGKNKCSNSCVVQKKFLNEPKNHNPPPLQVKWSVPKLNNRYKKKLYEGRNRSTGSTVLDLHWNIWQVARVGTNNLVFSSDYNAPTSFLEIYKKRVLAYMERDTLQHVSYKSILRLSVLLHPLPKVKSKGSSIGNALRSTVDVNHVNMN